ncbi:MAG: DUF378 domain-containing protein [Patescibacteria group bacterium]
MKVINWIALVLVVVGALNWGLIALFDLNLVEAIFGEASTLSNFVYILVGLSGLYALFLLPKLGKVCK